MVIGTILLTLLFIIFILFLILLPVMIRDGNRFVIREYRVFSDKIKEEHSFVFLTDLHEKVYKPGNRPLIEAVEKIDPELVIVGGDMITGASADPDDFEWAENALSVIKRLRERFPVYLCNGNHEQKIANPLYRDTFNDSYARYEKALSEIGVAIHRNEHEPLPGDASVELWNFEPDHSIFRKFHDHRISKAEVVQKIGDGPDPSKFNLVVTHHPIHFDPVAEWGGDLVLTGHIHGGIMRLPFLGGVISPDPQLFPKYSGGRYEISFDSNGKVTGRTGRIFRNDCEPLITPGGRKSVMVLSCGIGFHTIPIRIFNPAEISVIRLIPGNGKDMN